MITGVIKNKIDKIWTDIWAGGITNPLTVIEQLTYLMFIRSLDEKELETEEFANLTGETDDLIFPGSEIGQSMRWSKFKDRDPREIYDLISQRVFPAVKKMKYGKLPDFDNKGELIEIADREDVGQIQTAFSRYMDNAVFVIPRSEVAENDIPDIIARFRNLDGEKDRERTEKSFFVPKQEIADNDYDLSINKYKKTEYVAVEYPETSEIMGEIEGLYGELGGVLKELEGLLNE